MSPESLAANGDSLVSLLDRRVTPGTRLIQARKSVVCRFELVGEIPEHDRGAQLRFRLSGRGEWARYSLLSLTLSCPSASPLVVHSSCHRINGCSLLRDAIGASWTHAHSSTRGYRKNSTFRCLNRRRAVRLVEKPRRGSLRAHEGWYRIIVVLVVNSRTAFARRHAHDLVRVGIGFDLHQATHLNVKGREKDVMSDCGFLGVLKYNPG